MSKKSISLLWIKTRIPLGLLIIFSLALVLRVVPRLDMVFGSGWVRFGEVDPWYHIRLLENLLQHYPHQIAFDPFSYYPYGMPVQFAPFFDLLMGTVARILGWGAADLHNVEVMAAWTPAVLGALMILPVYFIGKALVNEKMGLIAAALIAILPGNFLARSLLGVTDHHVGEVLFSTLSALFLILAVKNARNSLTLTGISGENRRTFRLTTLYAVLSGISLGMYIATWVGGLLFVLIIFIYLIVQFILDHLKGISTRYLSYIAVCLFVAALLLVIPFLGKGGLSAMHPVSLAFGAAVFTALTVLDWLLARKKLKKFLFPLIVMGTIVVSAGIVYLLAPDLFKLMVSRFGIFIIYEHSETISEVQPLLSGFDITSFTNSRVWGFFTTGLFIVPAVIVLLVIEIIRKFKPETLFFLCWSLLMMAAMFGQNRFSYYFAINAAISGGYICWILFGWIKTGLRKWVFKRDTISENIRKSKRKSGNSDGSPSGSSGSSRKAVYASFGLTAVIGFMLVFYPNISPALAVSRIETGPSDDWHEALLWMKENTPEPFQTEDYFNSLYEAPPAGKNFTYPESAYGVLSAWDYGHWITTIAQRIPVSNPHQYGARTSSRYLLMQNETEANSYLKKLDSRYVIIDFPMMTSLYTDQAEWAEKNINTADYIETLYQRNKNGQIEPLTVFYPAYYRSIAARLYNFNGSQAIPDNTTWVFTYENRLDQKGKKYKLITFARQFKTFEEGEAYCRDNPACQIAGTDPFVSPVPLEKLQHYRQVYASKTTAARKGDRQISSVQIFEYIP